ncbi:MAG: hypothetical protein J5910_06010 [Lachnospiraceae bacterium]|nr:hypothetical protein [Lachnospiraceae bacterium]
MNELIEKIEQTVYELVQYKMNDYAVCAQELAEMLISELPGVINYYSDPRMQEFVEDAKYWPAQLERILNAFGDGDDLATIDILYNETRANLIELRDNLAKKGILR